MREDEDKIKKYMEDKKRKDKLENSRKVKEGKTKREKIQE
jgi:hypothetical protein